MLSMNRDRIPRADRVLLILEVRKAYKQFAELLRQYRNGSPRARVDFARATRQLSLMSLALALVALESSQPSL